MDAWIMILVIYVNGNSTVMNSVEFNSQYACEVAVKEARRKLGQDWKIRFAEPVLGMCVKK